IVSQIHERIPGSHWELFPESSHLPHIEEPARFKRVLSDFLSHF
ncbi:MAG: alpha/beta hydrolase, partial [Actinobacteria bacterium]|nr:alpha/beta hydrolase [Actinomycetota bacterium]